MRSLRDREGRGEAGTRDADVGLSALGWGGGGHWQGKKCSKKKERVAVR